VASFAARSTAHSPRAFLALTSAPAATSALTTMLWPPVLAKCSGMSAGELHQR